MARLGEADYRSGAKERLAEAFQLLRQQRFSGSIYLAGRAVEGILRAAIWKSDPDYRTGSKTLETGHDLRDMLKLVRNLGALRDYDLRESLVADVQKIARLWWNNMRFCPSTIVEQQWREFGEIGPRRTLKQAAQEFYDACSTVIRRCEALWQN